MADEANKPRISPFPRTFYVACTMEIFERMAWYGFFALSSLYITSPTAQGGLGMSSIERGTLQGIIPFLLYLFPVITGALADRYGYRRTFLIAFSMLTPSYILLGQFTSFWGFFAVFMLLAMGAATFKPVVVGTVGRTTDDSNRGLGFGIFYTIVNVGGFVGPLVAGYMRSISWDMVFVASAVWIGLNFIPALFFYKEPTTEADSGAKRSLKQVLLDAQLVLGNGRFALIAVPTLILLMLAGGEWITWTFCVAAAGGWIALNLVWNVLCPKTDDVPWYRQKARIGNWPFVTYLLILAGFWASFEQIFITMPEYIRDFVDTSDLVRGMSFLPDSVVSFLAAVNPQDLQNEIVRLLSQFGAVNADQAHDVLLKLVHYKVRPPEAELQAAFTQLAPLLTGMKSATAAFAGSVFDPESWRHLLTQMVQAAPDPAPFLAVAKSWTEAYRQVNPEYIINIDAGAIVVFQILVSLIIQRWQPFPVLVAGALIAGGGIAFGAVAFSGVTVVLSIVIFALGEMVASPKSQEYVARIAPSDKVALFMGYYFVSIALGNLLGGIMSGWGYEVLALEMNRPDIMWILFGGAGLATAIALVFFNKLVVPRLEAQRQQG